MAQANERQVGGDHYKGAAIEHWDIVAQHQLDYFQGQIIKYVMRWKKKGGGKDLEKAKHFLEKYTELAQAGVYGNPAIVKEWTVAVSVAPLPEPVAPLPTSITLTVDPLTCSHEWEKNLGVVGDSVKCSKCGKVEET